MVTTIVSLSSLQRRFSPRSVRFFSQPSRRSDKKNILGKTKAYEILPSSRQEIKKRMKDRPCGTYLLTPYKEHSQKLLLSWVDEENTLRCERVNLKKDGCIDVSFLAEVGACDDLPAFFKKYSHLFKLPLPIVESLENLQRYPIHSTLSWTIQWKDVFLDQPLSSSQFVKQSDS